MCDYDWISFRSGNSTYGKFCGSMRTTSKHRKLPSKYSVSPTNECIFTFHSDYSNEEPYHGFMAHYSAVGKLSLICELESKLLKRVPSGLIEQQSPASLLLSFHFSQWNQFLALVAYNVICFFKILTAFHPVYSKILMFRSEIILQWSARTKKIVQKNVNAF